MRSRASPTIAAIWRDSESFSNKEARFSSEHDIPESRIHTRQARVLNAAAMRARHTHGATPPPSLSCIMAGSACCGTEKRYCLTSSCTKMSKTRQLGQKSAPKDNKETALDSRRCLSHFGNPLKAFKTTEEVWLTVIDGFFQNQKLVLLSSYPFFPARGLLAILPGFVP